MRTETRSKILKLIEQNGKMRPFELRQALNLSGVAIHRQLSLLLEKGIVEVRGSAPFTQYVLAGTPDLGPVASWLTATAPTESPENHVCATRDIFLGRLPHLKDFIKDNTDLLSLVISTAGEIGNNSFDHNSGQWRDVSGCWFEAQATGNYLWIFIADRGQGIYQSLVQVHSELADEQAAINAAFETIISGRSPERRGNGLKYVKKNLSTTIGRGLACISGHGRVHYGEQGERCLQLLEKHFENAQGTITLMAWRLQ